jgi:hypothetical protein
MVFRYNDRFRIVFLVKTSNQEVISGDLDKSDVLRTLNRLAEVFSTCSARVQSKHFLHSVTKSLEIALKRLGPSALLGSEHAAMAQEENMFMFDNFGSDSFLINDLGGHDNLFHTPMDGFHDNFWGIQNP